jgi:hypothetical protein
MKVYFLIVGILITLVGLYLLYRRIYFLLHAQSAKGKVVSYEVRSFDDDSQDFYPVIRFSLEDGQEYTFTSVAALNKKQYPEGQEVPILYLPSRPQDAFIHSFLHFWAAPLGFLVLGSAGIATMFVG